MSSSTLASSPSSTSGSIVSSAATRSMPRSSPSSAALNAVDATSSGAAPHTVVVDVVPSSAVRAMSEACRDGEKLPGALILGGVLEAAAALWLAIFRKPEGLFDHHGAVLFCLYYVVVLLLVLFGFAEAAVGFWVSGDLDGRRAAGMKMMCFSVLPLVFVAGLGGFASPIPK